MLIVVVVECVCFLSLGFASMRLLPVFFMDLVNLFVLEFSF